MTPALKSKQPNKPLKFALQRKKTVQGIQPAIQRKKTIQGLEKEIDTLWKKIIYENWGNKCAWPGCNVTQPPKQLYCHHYFHKAQGNWARWEPLNGILLCYGHHMGQVHRSGNVEPIREVLIRKLGIEGFEILKLRVSMVFKPTPENLQELKEKLSNFSL